MPAFIPKPYQASALSSVETYFRTCREMGNADYAFQETTKELWGQKSGFTPLNGFSEEMPYFCLRVPTGGGKTYLAAKTVALANNHLLLSEHSVILWLVPSKAIRSQTLAGLRQIDHPYHLALREAGPVTVLDLDEAKALTRSALETSTVVIVATRQAFQVGNEEIRKVYESSGALMHLFENLEQSQREKLLYDSERKTRPCSLANVLRLRRPFVIIDEAHNSRTELAFDTLAKFNPSGIMELTATPDMVKTPSNVLHAVSAVELKRAEMIKLPIQLETVSDDQRCLALGLDQREQLEVIAKQEEAKGATYLRPLVLIQSEPKSKNKQTRHAEWVKNELMSSNHYVPEEEIVIATGSERGLETLEADFEGGIFSPRCPVKYVITQQALAEGWDCAFAYVLVSLAGVKSATRVEQLLGRILRQPQAKRRENEALNRSYAYVVSRDFGETAETLRECLVQSAGFNHQEAVEFVRAQKSEQNRFDFGRTGRIHVQPVEVSVPENLDLSKVSKELKKKISWQKKSKTLTLKVPLTEEETVEIQKAAVMDTSRELIQRAAETSRTKAVTIFHHPSERGEPFLVPQLEVMIEGELRLFDEPEAIDYPWDLPAQKAEVSKEELDALQLASQVSEAGVIDVNQDVGKLETKFIKDLSHDLGLSYRPEHWDEVKLAAWLCRQLREPFITHSSLQVFVLAWLTELLSKEGFSLARANRDKFQLRTLLEKKIKALRNQAVEEACQQFLFDQGREERIFVGTEYTFQFHPDAYAPTRDDRNEYGHHEFKKHYYPRMGAYDSKEEYLCACWWIVNLRWSFGCGI